MKSYIGLTIICIVSLALRFYCFLSFSFKLMHRSIYFLSLWISSNTATGNNDRSKEIETFSWKWCVWKVCNKILLKGQGIPRIRILMQDWEKQNNGKQKVSHDYDLPYIEERIRHLISPMPFSSSSDMCAWNKIEKIFRNIQKYSEKFHLKNRKFYSGFWWSAPNFS